MVASADVARALLQDAGAAQLMPYKSKKHPFDLVFPLSTTVSTGVAWGQPLPAADQTWLTIAAFAHLTKDQKSDALSQTGGILATVLQRRMRFLRHVVELSMTTKCDWQSCFPPTEGLLTAPAAQGDRFDWRRVLCKLLPTVDKRYTGTSPTSAFAALRWNQPRFLIEWDGGYGRVPVHFPAMLETFLHSAFGDSSVDELLLLPSVIEACRQESASFSVHSRRVVELGLSFKSGCISTSTLFRIFEVLDHFGKSSHESTSPIEFRVTSFQIQLPFGEITGGAAELLGQVLRESKYEYLHLKEIELAQLGSIDGLSIQRCLRDLTCPPTQCSTSSPSGRTHMRLAIQNASESFARLGSAVRYESSLQEIDISFAEDDMEGLAAWLAFGFFHCDSLSRVETLCLDQHGSGWCTQRFVDIFTRVLSSVVSPNDLAPLNPRTLQSGKRKRVGVTADLPLDELPLPHDRRVFVKVAAKTKTRDQPTTRAAVVAILMEESESETVVRQFQVVRQLRGWLAVVVPGFGAGWIERQSVTEEFSLHSQVSHKVSTNRCIKSFTWIRHRCMGQQAAQQQHADALVHLLGLVDDQLEVLQLPINALEAPHVGRILGNCRNLTTLNLCGNNISNIEPLVRAYEQDLCKISCLSIAQDSLEVSAIIGHVTQILMLCCESGGSTGRKKPPI